MFVMAGTVADRGKCFNYLRGNGPHRPTHQDLAHAPAPEPARPRAGGGRAPRGISPSSRRAAPGPASRWSCTSPSTSTSRCASATGCCSPRATRPSTRSARSTSPSSLRSSRRSTSSSKAHEPFPAVVIDRASNLVAANGAVALLTQGVAPHLLEPPVNVLRARPAPRGDGAADRRTSASGAPTSCTTSQPCATRPATRSSTTLYDELERLSRPDRGTAGPRRLRPAEDRRPDVPLHPHDVRHRGRRHRLRARDRGLLPR